MRAPAGWYHDPGDGGRLRFFDGVNWTENYAPLDGPVSAPPSGVPDPSVTSPQPQPPSPRNGRGDAWRLTIALSASVLAVVALALWLNSGQSSDGGGGSEDPDCLPIGATIYCNPNGASQSIRSEIAAHCAISASDLESKWTMYEREIWFDYAGPKGDYASGSKDLDTGFIHC